MREKKREKERGRKDGSINHRCFSPQTEVEAHDSYSVHPLGKFKHLKKRKDTGETHRMRIWNLYGSFNHRCFSAFPDVDADNSYHLTSLGKLKDLKKRKDTGKIQRLWNCGV